MIERVFVLPKLLLQRIVAQHPSLLDAHFVISICDPGEERPLPDEHSHLLNLTFCDIAPEDIPEAQRQRFPAMSPEDAGNVVGALRRWQEMDLRGNLIVQCHAGISRSGAVGSFANELFGLSSEQFQKQHPWVEPHPHVFNLLRMAADL
jgi:predicted protein tyrosine phosphatase